MSAKQYGTAWIYSAMPCRTGFIQPFGEYLRYNGDFTPDYAAFFDQRGALIAHERRAGWFA